MSRMIITKCNIAIPKARMYWLSARRSLFTPNTRPNSKNLGWVFIIVEYLLFIKSYFFISIFRQLQQFDCELKPLKEILVEYPITFPPSYPYEEEPTLPNDYMNTRCPAWCDRILMSPAAKNLIIDNTFSSSNYNTIGDDICMGDHKVMFQHKFEYIYVNFTYIFEKPKIKQFSSIRFNFFN